MTGEQFGVQTTFLVALLAMLIGHQVGDHVAQTDKQAVCKSMGGWAGARALAGHITSYHLTVFGVLAVTAYTLDVSLSPTGVAAGLAFSVVTHAVLDLRFPVRHILRLTRSPAFAEQTTPVSGMYVADQALHWLALLISALMIARL